MKEKNKDGEIEVRKRQRKNFKSVQSHLLQIKTHSFSQRKLFTLLHFSVTSLFQIKFPGEIKKKLIQRSLTSDKANSIICKIFILFKSKNTEFIYNTTSITEMFQSDNLLKKDHLF